MIFFIGVAGLVTCGITECNRIVGCFPLTVPWDLAIYAESPFGNWVFKRGGCLQLETRPLGVALTTQLSPFGQAEKLGRLPLELSPFPPN